MAKMRGIMSRMDYYDAWPKWRMPTWLGAALGAVFTAIVLVCGMMIVKLTHRSAPAVATAPVVVEQKAAVVVAAPLPVEPAAAPAQATVSNHARPHKSSAKKGPAMLAKHDSRSKRSSKDPIDRLLGL
jgi:hypothetical protein